MDTGTQAKVTVSIVSGRHPEYLAGCLGSLPVAAHRIPLEVYVIDNIAEFDVAKVIQQSYPAAKIIKNTNRKGFGANHNQVLRICNTSYALILNDDTILGENCIDLLAEFLNNHPMAGWVGPAVYPRSWNASPVYHYPHIIRAYVADILKELGLLQLIRGLFIRRNIRQTSADKLSQPLILDQIVGACFLIRKKVLDEIGLFDERFFMYYEDQDLALRASQQGWQSYLVPDAKIIHFIGGSINKKTAWRKHHSLRYFVYKHYRGLTRIFNLLIPALYRLIKCLKYSR